MWNSGPPKIVKSNRRNSNVSTRWVTACSSQLLWPDLGVSYFAVTSQLMVWSCLYPVPRRRAPFHLSHPETGPGVCEHHELSREALGSHPCNEKKCHVHCESPRSPHAQAHPRTLRQRPSSLRVFTVPVPIGTSHCTEMILGLRTKHYGYWNVDQPHAGVAPWH